jgi:hypothetical protein
MLLHHRGCQLNKKHPDLTLLLLSSRGSPWSMYLLTTLLISWRSLSVISVFFGLSIWPITLMMSCDVMQQVQEVVAQLQ